MEDDRESQARLWAAVKKHIDTPIQLCTRNNPMPVNDPGRWEHPDATEFDITGWDEELPSRDEEGVEASWTIVCCPNCQWWEENFYIK